MLSCLASIYRFINSHNRKHVSFKAGINHLADRLPEEIMGLRGRIYTAEYNGGLPFSSDLAVEDIPDTMDWRLRGTCFHHEFFLFFVYALAYALFTH